MTRLFPGLLLRFPLALFLLFAAPALAQPMMGGGGMPDPSQMSGIPRPDPKVPAGTITVRLIRGSFANPLAGVEAELVNTVSNDKRREKTDAAGRATFSGLPSGTYEARAVVDGDALASQPIELSASPGIAVMLVFEKSAAEQQKELGKPDGKARVDQALPGGVLLIKVVDETGQPLPGLQVVANHADRGTEKVDALAQKTTGADGTARYEGLLTGAGDGYLVSVLRDGAAYRSKPFRLVQNHGSQLVMEARKISGDISRLSIGQGSHFIVQLQDEMVEVLENIFLHNPLEQALDPGLGGLRLPLAEGALSTQLLPNSSPSLSIDVSRADRPPEVVWKGPVPPGDTQVSVAFLLKHTDTLSFRQATPIGFDGLHVLAEKVGEIKMEGPRTRSSTDTTWSWPRSPRPSPAGPSSSP
jgi:hypothetical protein